MNVWFDAKYLNYIYILRMWLYLHFELMASTLLEPTRRSHQLKRKDKWKPKLFDGPTSKWSCWLPWEKYGNLIDNFSNSKRQHMHGNNALGGVSCSIAFNFTVCLHARAILCLCLLKLNHLEICWCCRSLFPKTYHNRT